MDAQALQSMQSLGLTEHLEQKMKMKANQVQISWIFAK